MKYFLKERIPSDFEWNVNPQGHELEVFERCLEAIEEELEWPSDFDALLEVTCLTEPDVSEETGEIFLRNVLDQLIRNRILDVKFDGNWIITENIFSAEAGEETLLMSRDHPKVHVLNHAAHLLWSNFGLIKNFAHLDEVCTEAWGQLYDEVKRNELRIFVATLFDGRLLKPQINEAAR